jgi:hypothetical protein
MARVVALALLVAACKPVADGDVPPAESPGQHRAPTRHAKGDVLDVNVPLASGDVLALATLRGKVVVLELSDAVHRDAAALADYDRLLAAHAERLAVIVVSLDKDPWDAPPSSYAVGWDPDGALAARLQASALPMVLVLDAEGRIAFQHGGADEGARAHAIATVEELVAAK